MNYTRHYPAGSYNVYARLASGGGATTCTLSQVTSGWGTSTQATTLLGTFSVANTAWESYNFVSLEDNLGQLATLAFNGSTNTLQLRRPGTATSDCNANFLMLVPILAIQAKQSGTNIVLSFPTQSGFNYQVQYRNSLTDAGWTALAGGIAGNNAAQTMNDPVTSSPRFYRVQVQ